MRTLSLESILPPAFMDPPLRRFKSAFELRYSLPAHETQAWVHAGYKQTRFRGRFSILPVVRDLGAKSCWLLFSASSARPGEKCANPVPPDLSPESRLLVTRKQLVATADRELIFHRVEKELRRVQGRRHRFTTLRMNPPSIGFRPMLK